MFMGLPGADKALIKWLTVAGGINRKKTDFNV